MAVRKVQHLPKFIEQESRKDLSAPEHCLGGGDLPLLGMCEGVRLLELNSEWKWRVMEMARVEDRQYARSTRVRWILTW